MEIRSQHFAKHAKINLVDQNLQTNLTKLKEKFVDMRQLAVTDFGGFEALRLRGEAIRQQALDHLPYYLQTFERQAQGHGTQVLYARDGAEARALIKAIAQQHAVRKIIKTKSMVSEEIALNPALTEAGLEVIETDLGEYILQINDNERPSHIIAPVVHKSLHEVSTLFARVHQTPAKTEIPALTKEARAILRQHFVTADMGISGGNFLIAETGQVALVTNEGNGRLSTTMPKVHVALTGIEKVVPTLADYAILLRLLTRSATGQSISNYATLIGGPADAQQNGPALRYVIILDNNRSAILRSSYRAILHCIRCGACMNHCPVYQKIGGHPYGWVYPGPMGTILTSLHVGLAHAPDLAQAATLCNQCGAVCPVRIPLSGLIRNLRADQVRQKLVAKREFWLFAAWSYVAMRPRLYRVLTRWSVATTRFLPQITRFTAVKALLAGRHLPKLSHQTFFSMYKNKKS